MFGWLRRPEARAGGAPPAPLARAAAPERHPGSGAAERLLRRLEWTVLRRLDGRLQGDYRTLFRGFGLDFADLREYLPGDDVRHMDWNVTARLGTPHVREFQEDRQVDAWFLVDLSGSVDFGSTGRRKRELAIELVGVLARLLVRSGNRCGAILYRGSGAGERVVPAGASRRHVLHLLDRMLRPPGDTAAAGGTDLGALLGRALPLIRRRSVVCLVSDFLSLPGWEAALGRLVRRHEAVAVRLYDPLEIELPDLGLVVFEDAESGAQLSVDTHDRGFRRRHAALARAREEALRAALARAGVDCLELATAEPIDEALLRFVALRKRRAQLAAGGGAAPQPVR